MPIKRYFLRQAVFFISALFMISCSDPGGFDESSVTSSTSTRELKLYLFSAGWCPTCKVELPQIQSLIDSSLVGKERLAVTLYVGEQDISGVPANQAFAQKYRDRLGLGFEAKVDPFPWRTYRKFFKMPIRILSAVVLDEQDQVVKTFQVPDLSAQSVVNYLNAQLSIP